MTAKMDQWRRKRLDERRYFEILRKQCPDFPEGKLVRGETPDFSVVNTRRLGVEVTTYNGEARSDEEFFSQVVVEARRRYLQAGGRPCVAKFWYHPWPVRHGLQVDALAAQLAQVVRRWCPPPDTDHVKLDWRHFEHMGLNHLARIVPEMHLSTIDGLQIFAWEPWAGYLQHPVEVIQRQLAAKERSVLCAQATHDDVWLLMVAEGRSPSRMLDPGQVREHRFVCSAERLYLIDLWAPHLYRLQVARPAAADCEAVGAR